MRSSCTRTWSPIENSRREWAPTIWRTFSAIGVAVARQGIDRDQAFDEKLFELDEKAKAGRADDHRVEMIAHTVDHELHLFPLHELTFGLVGPAFGL